jgi:hypothetical protein
MIVLRRNIRSPDHQARRAFETDAFRNVITSDIEDWAEVHGRWDSGEGWTTYLGSASANDDAGLLLAPNDHTLVRGAISARVEFEDGAADDGPSEAQARIVVGYDQETGAYIAAGMGGHNARYVIEALEPEHNQLRPIKLRGKAPKRWPKQGSFSVQVRGRHIALAVNKTTVLSALLPRPLAIDERIGLSAWGPAPVRFESVAIESELPAAFVVMQFKRYGRVYSEVIRPLGKADDAGSEGDPPTGEAPGVVALTRVDEVLHASSIIEDIEGLIAQADLVIAEITENNANVFYEAGYAFALNKPVLLLANRGRAKDLPFDLLGKRCLFYVDSPAGRKAAAADLRRRVEATLTQRGDAQRPWTQARTQRDLGAA